MPSSTFRFAGFLENFKAPDAKTVGSRIMLAYKILIVSSNKSFL